MVLAVPAARADVAGWLIARGQDLGLGTAAVVAWSDIQRGGGIKLSAVEVRAGRLFLPTQCTGGPFSSLFGAGRAEFRRSGRNLVLTIAQRPGSQIKPADRGPLRYARLPNLADGTYAVYYEIPGDPARKLGTIEVRNPARSSFGSLR
jgi:hypothetical protein